MSSSYIKRPVQIQEFTLTVQSIDNINELYKIQSELTNSIAKLKKTNSRLTKYLETGQLDNDSDEESDEELPVSQEDKNLYKEIIDENEIVISNQEERLQIVSDELLFRKETPTSTTKNVDPKSSKNSTLDTDNAELDTTAPNSVFI